ncbi:hypothetical protein [Microbispora sp. GKU 823]|uniref:hypothetical protein n=1 Tax=Microbispora sp. GKU 823 TaxID=1652100 RepID=UPI002118B80D|nr:hypothetical protein [Microbispora sp. GKU 823]
MSSSWRPRSPRSRCTARRSPRPGSWRRRLSAEDAELVEKVAREELTRLGYR